MSLVVNKVSFAASTHMSLCIVGSETLDELEACIGTLGFDAIKNKNVRPKEWLESPYGPDQLCKRVEVVPVRDTRSLKVRFPIPDLNDEYKANPAQYLTHLIEHKGKGSLLSELKRLGWVSSIFAGVDLLARGMSCFDVIVDLSMNGLDHVEDILCLLFNYIGLVKRTGALSWVHEELSELGELKFRFLDKENPVELVRRISADLRRIPFDDILSWRYLLSEYNPDRIMEIVEMLTPDNMFYVVVAKRFKSQDGNTEEPIYKTEMRIVDVDQETMDKFKKALTTSHPAFHMPEKNDFIPTKFEQKPREAVKSEYPRVIQDGVWCRIWFKQDDEYKLPKMVTKVAVTAPVIASDPRSTVLSSMYVWCLNDALTEETCNAEIAGLRYKLELGTFGTNLEQSDRQKARGPERFTESLLTLHVTGYDEKQPTFVKRIVKRMADFKPGQ